MSKDSSEKLWKKHLDWAFRHNAALDEIDRRNGQAAPHEGGDLADGLLRTALMAIRAGHTGQFAANNVQEAWDCIMEAVAMLCQLYDKLGGKVDEFKPPKQADNRGEGAEWETIRDRQFMLDFVLKKAMEKSSIVQEWVIAINRCIRRGGAAMDFTAFVLYSRLYPEKLIDAGKSAGDLIEFWVAGAEFAFEMCRQGFKPEWRVTVE